VIAKQKKTKEKQWFAKHYTEMSRLCNTSSTRNQAVNSCVPEEETVLASLVSLVAVTRATY
jgi:hypothetical protein